MLNVSKGVENGFKLASKHSRYDIGLEDITNIFRTCDLAPNDRVFKLLQTAFYLGLQQGHKIARKEAKA